MGRVKLAIFDLDGTLLDTIGDLAASCDAVMQMNGLPQHTTDEYRQMVGRGILRLVEAAIPEQMRLPEYVEKVRRDFVAYYLDHIDLHTHPYNGIPELINAMTERGVKIAVASNKFQAGTERLIRSFFPDVEFVAVLGQRVGVPLKPDPQIDLEIIEAAGVEPSETLHIGDSGVDMQTAHAAGVRAVGVTWGFRSREELAESGADVIVDHPEEILNLL
ncbi:MAG: HAD-IA family hydrolase [Alistipes sp.]|nr:HAD-IA family hydrolase [Alistipes sp.]MBQ3247454.1 HAD-IA family hydrolase [Alistipes sp.]